MLLSYASLWWLLGVGGRAADWVTLVRFCALLALGSALMVWREISWVSWTCLLLIVLCDLVDGWCARLFGGSVAGSILDMETDQFVTMSLALCGYWLLGIGAWILLLPAFKYAYVLFLMLLGMPSHDPKPRETGNRRGRLICALVMTLLLTCLAPLAAGPVRLVASLGAVLALAYSFGSDALYLARRKRKEAAAVHRTS